MGLTCSLLGHAFEADGVEREREQRGDEVVTVVREVETCRRCGERRAVSETTEVTTVIDPEETGTDSGGTTAPGADEGAGAGAGSEATPDAGRVGSAPGGLDGMVDRAEMDDRPVDTDETPTHPRVDPGEAEGRVEPSESPAEEDAEIIEGGDGERPPGEWPDADDEGQHEEPPRSGDDGDADVPSEPAGEPRYVCEECGFTEPTVDSPLREGDSCPECGAGWLTVEGDEP